MSEGTHHSQGIIVMQGVASYLSVGGVLSAVVVEHGVVAWWL